MNLPWDANEILAFAPDPSSAKAGRGLAGIAHWLNLGYSDRAVWGECKGSAKVPYQVQVDLSEPAFKCTCPSRKFPCKHGIGLLLLFDSSSNSFAGNEAPEWVSAWLVSRESRVAEKKKRSESEVTVDAEAQAKRAANRAAKVSAGLDEVYLWMQDLVNQGLANLNGKPHAFWDTKASRLVDAQAPGMARLIRELAGVSIGQNWPDRLLRRLATLTTIIEAWRRIDTLPDDLQSEVRALIGFTQQAAELDKSASLHDEWLILGRAIEQDDRLKVQRTWIRGVNSQREAMVLNFAVGDSALDASLAPGLKIPASAAFFPGIAPQRAVMRERSGPGSRFTSFRGGTISEESLRYRAALAGKPWMERFPFRLSSVVPVQDGDKWLIRDEQGVELPTLASDAVGWSLAALSCGRPISVFGEWDSEMFKPLSAIAGERFIALEEIV